MVKITDVMTRDPATLRPNSTIEEAVRLMAAHHIEGIPVVDETHKPIGLVTIDELFLQRRSFGISYEKQYTLFKTMVDPERLWEAYEDHRTLPVSEIMVRGFSAVDTNATIRQVAQIMSNQHVDYVLVTEKDRLVGIATRFDLICRIMKIY